MTHTIHHSCLTSLIAEMRPRDAEEVRYLEDKVRCLERDNEYLRLQLAVATARLCAK